MSDEILRNSAALNALKRHQLVSLSKRYGLKASGKNVEIIQRLEDYAVSHANDLDFYIPSPAPTPGPSTFSDAPSSEASTPLASRTMPTQQAGLAPTPLRHKVSEMSVASRRSEAWEVLSDSGASMISLKKRENQSRGMTKSGSCSSWKSSNNGEALSEFGGNNTEKASSTSSMKALATSLTRRGSRILLGRSTSASSHLSQAAEPEPEVEQDHECVEEVVDDASLPPSPASTVGVPRRHSRISILERPSTIRLCSPTPKSPEPHVSENEEDELPFFGKAKNIHTLKERRSLAPLRSSMGSTTALSPTALGRKSMPALPSSQSASIKSIYPALPAMPAQYAQEPAINNATPLPGTFPPLSPTPSRAQMIFGSPAAQGVSNHQFSEAAQAVLREMNAKLPGGGAQFGEELLKGRNAEMNKLVQVNERLGTGGWGLSASQSGNKDRFAHAHQQEFAKMRSISKSSLAPRPAAPRMASSATMSKLVDSPAGGKRKHELTRSSSSARIPSAPNGAPLVANSTHDDGRQAKRTRLSNGPNYLGSLKEAGKSIANLLGEEKGKSGDEMMRKMKERRDKRRSSLVKSKGRTLSSRFGFLRSKKASTAADLTRSTSTTLSAMESSHSTAPTLTRSSSVYAPREVPQPRKHFDLEASLARKPTTAARRRSTDLSNVIKPHPEVLEDTKSPSVDGRHQSRSHAPKDRNRSISAQTTMSQGSATPRRAKIPDFAPPPWNSNRAASSSTNTLGLPKPYSTSSSLALSKKASQAEVIKNARPAPPPPSAYTEGVRAPPSHASTRPASIHRSSTLYMPTASSLARMQATIKPNPERPLPVPPAPSTPRIATTVGAFGAASSRDNLFESNFNMSKPANPPSSLRPKTGSNTPGKPMSSAARLRAKHSGLQAVKSKGNLREEMEVKRKRSEIKARQERRVEERGLREMLGEF